MSPFGTSSHYQCVGVGVGPSNLSMASLLDKHDGIRNAFFDRKPEFSWHDQMQFPGADLQVSWIKDLVSLADPTNRFSFLAYLHSKGRIYHFLNARFDKVARAEFRDYLKWASDSNENIHFGEEVVRIDFDGNFIVETTKRRLTAENIAVGVGAEPAIPTFVQDQLCASQFHVSEFASKSKELARKHVVVVGGGQSGAEAVLHLITCAPEQSPRQVTWISRRENFLPLDDSSFTNDYFMPCHSDYFYEQSRAFREAFVERNVLGSDGISEQTLRRIYQRIYAMRFLEDNSQTVVLMPGRTVQWAGRDREHWTLFSSNGASGDREISHADVVIWATGFHTGRMDFLAPLKNRLGREGDEFEIDDDFAVQWDGPPHRCIFMFNAVRRQRGLPDPNLSLTAWRAQRAIDRIRGIASAQQLPSFVTWCSTSRPALTDRKVV